MLQTTLSSNTKYFCKVALTPLLLFEIYVKLWYYGTLIITKFEMYVVLVGVFSIHIFDVLVIVHATECFFELPS